jgi:LAO/AO transport system kinase
VVQAMKAGIMEMADIYAVNKADLPGAQKMATDIKRISAISRRPEGAWRAPVLLVTSSQPETVAALSHAIDQHQAWLAEGRRRDELLLARARYRLRRLIERRAADAVAAFDARALEAPLEQQMDQALRAIRGPG